VIEPITIDLELMGAPGVVAAYLLPQNGGGIVVDSGPGSTLPKLLEGLRHHGLEPRDVKHLLLTHIHLDHAGAAGQLAREHGWRVYVHRHGATHLLRPERLIESATRIYGAMMDTLWGSFEPVPEQQLTVLKGAETLYIADLEVRTCYTPGHAVHHIAYGIGDNLFSGDVGGVRLQGSSHVVPPTPPPDINLEVWRSSVNQLRALNPKRIYPTHFGGFNDATAHLDTLEANLDALEQLSLEVLRNGGNAEDIASGIKRLTKERLNDKDLEYKYELSTPHLMAANGLLRYWQKHRPDALS
jgi:glyoxylase-like metal-dependent hydrolase (beta-lactamase superfamily II)